MKEKTYFFNGTQKKIKLLAASLLCVGHASLLLATRNMEDALLQQAEPLQRSAAAKAEKTFYVVTDENKREVGKQTTNGSLGTEPPLKHWTAFSAATRSCKNETNVGLTLTDYKAEGSDGGDQVYAYQPMKEKLPRGLATTKDSSGTLLHQLCGLRKFDYDWSYVTEKQIQSAKEIKLYAMEKENGSAAHISAFMQEDQLYWVIGSKNSHKILSDTTFQKIAEDTWQNAASYQFGPQGDYAQNIIYLWRQIWNNLEPNKQEAIKDRMTKDGITFVGEAIFKGDQHLKQYFADEAPSQGDILFFAMTHPTPLKDGLLAKTPQEGLKLFNEYGLKQAPIITSITLNPSDFVFGKDKRTIKAQAYSDLVQEITRKENSEGAALYMTLIDQQGKEKTVDLKKCKAAEYTLMRKVREHVLGQKSLEAGIISQKLKNSIKDFEEDQQETLKGLLTEKQKHYEYVVSFFRESGVLATCTATDHSDKNQAAADKKAEIAELRQKIAKTTDRKEKATLGQQIKEINEKNKPVKSDPNPELNKRKAAIRSQWVSIEEQLKDHNKQFVAIEVDGKMLSFSKSLETSE